MLESHMGNCPSKKIAHPEQQGDNLDAIKIKKVYQAFLLAKKAY